MHVPLGVLRFAGSLMLMAATTRGAVPRDA